MAVNEVYQCQCENCQQSEAHPDKRTHHRMNVFLSRLDEQQRRWYVALEAEKMGHGGNKRMAIVTGLNVKTVRQGKRELAQELVTRPRHRVRVAGGGRKAVEKKSRA